MSLIDFLLLILLNIIWGSAYAVAGYTMLFFAPFFLYSIRFLMTAGITLPFYKIPKNLIHKIIILSIFQIITFLGVALGVKNLESSISAILIKLDIPFSMILATIFLKEKLTKQMIFGILICFFAVYFLSGNFSFNNFGYIIILIIASFSSGCANVYIKTIKNTSSQQIVCYNSLFTGLGLLLVSFLFENNFVLKTLDIKVIILVLYLGIFSTYIAYLIFYYLLNKYDISKIMPYNFLRPIISIIAGYLILSESITLYKVIGCGLMLLGIYIIEKKIYK